ncbi:MAG: ABC transporter permease, partial [Gemmatimonadota bacterium]
MPIPDEPGAAPLPDPIFEQPAADEVADELAFHVEMRTRELIARGTAPELAARQARERFSNLSQVSSECRDIAERRDQSLRRTRYFTNLLQDIQFALRMLVRRPAFAALCILTIGLGIGASTAIYSVVDGVMLRPLPFADPGRLVAIWVTEQRFRDDATLRAQWDRIVMGQEEYDGIRAHPATVTGIALWGRGRTVAVTPRGAAALPSLRVTSNMLTTLRLHPFLGRDFLPGDDVLNGPKVAMLSWETWQAEWHGDSSVIGRSIVLDDAPHTVIGILPRGLRMDRAAPIAAVWTPALQDSNDLVQRHNRSYAALARLKPGATLGQANAELSAVLSKTAIDSRGAERGKGVAARVEEWQVDQTRTVRASLWILFGAVGLLLLIACVNVATLMLGEAARRESEIAARVALGAGPARIARQLLTESITVSVLGAVVGCAIAAGSVRILVALAPAGIPGIDAVRLDARAVSFAVAIAGVTGMLFGLAPALVLLRRGQQQAVRVGAGQTARGGRALQHALIAIEIALSLVLLAGCTLLGRSLQRLTATAPGFDTQGLTATQFTFDRATRNDDARLKRFIAIATREVAAIPGVAAVTAGTGVPFTVGNSSSPVKSDAREYGPEQSGGNAQQRSVLPGYLEAMRIPLLAGRTFNENDREGGELVIIVG